ncbi:MAG: hypothetical protein JXR83_15545 [Deltaproteobacteria bacterium]|nr:hypothetical protein [Deltaproteobacteria bacterium]
MTPKMLALVFGVAAVVSTALFPVMDHISARSEQAELELFAAEPYVVTAQVIEQEQLSTMAAKQLRQQVEYSRQ